MREKNVCAKLSVLKCNTLIDVSKICYETIFKDVAQFYSKKKQLSINILIIYFFQDRERERKEIISESMFLSYIWKKP